MSALLRPALWFVRSAGARPRRSRPPNSRVRGMRLATISSSASARSQDRATSCRRCARDDRMNRNRYNCRYAPAVSSPHPFAHEKFFAVARHPEVLEYPRIAGAEGSHAFFATRVAPAREMNSANPQRKPFGSEIPTTENDRAFPMRRDQESNLQSQRLPVVSLVAVGKRRREDSPKENVNPLKLR